MDKQKNDENIVLKLKRHLSKMMVQIDFLYRNGREMSQFDYDMLMDRTREFYELLVDVQVDNQDYDYDHDHDDERVEINEGGEVIDHDVEFEIETPGNEEESFDKPKEKSEDKLEEEDEEDEDWEDEDDEIFSIAPTVEEQNHVNPVNPVSNQNHVDNSLAARLQRQPISDIKSAVSINDRIMMIQDLFKGSEERYNKIINELNEFPTLGGAMVYLSELGVQLQWDTDSEAFLKLQELVERRFL